MADFSYKPAFNAGELSPSLYGRTDFNKFDLGASTMRNLFCSYRGGAFSRAGTMFVGYSKQNQGNHASGYIDFTASGNPSPGNTVTLNGVVWTFVSGTPTGNQVQIGGDVGFTLANFRIALNASVDPLLTVATYTQDNTTFINIRYKTIGTIGNAYTLAASAATRSGPTLTGGTGSVSTPPRLITFQFNINQGLVLEFGNQYMRVISAGDFVTNTPVAITAATQANPCRVTSAVAISNGDWVAISGVQGMTQLNGRTFVAQNVGGGAFDLTDVFGNSINSATYGAYTGGGTAAVIYTLATPYADVDLPFLKFTQSADVMSLVLRNQETGTEYAPYELARLADNNWTLTPFNTDSSISAPAGLAGTANTTTMTDPTDYKYVVTAVDRLTGGESVASNIADVPDSVDISSTAGSISLSWQSVSGARYYNVYKATPAFKATVPDGALFGFMGSYFGNAAVDNNIVQDMTLVPPLHVNPFARGQIVDVDMTVPGSGVTNTAWSITTSTGTGFDGYPVLVDGSIPTFVVTDPGENYQPGDTITFVDPGGTPATGAIAINTNPSPGNTITLGGTVWTFVASGATGLQINIGFNIGGTVAFAVATLNASADPNTAKCHYTNGGSTQINIAYKINGSVGNSFTLGCNPASGSGTFTLSGVTLSGGSGGQQPLGTLVVGPESGTYPSVVAYFQQRRVYGNSANQPDTYWMSQPGAYSNFDSRVPTIDSDAITGTPWSVQVDGIQFILPLLGSAMMLTGQTVYLVSGAGGSPTAPVAITPSSQQALPQAYNGCHFHVPPQLIDYDVYYLQAKGSVIRSASYNFWIGVLNSIDVTYLSSHLFTGYSINAMAWCEEPYKVMWCVRSDGALLSLTSLKAQDVMGWARHDTQGLFVGATSVTEPPVDALYVVTQRFTPDGNSPFMIERMDNRIWNGVETAWCVDCGLELPQPTPNSTLLCSSATGLGQPVGYQDLVPGSGYTGITTGAVEDEDGGIGDGCTVTVSTAGGAVTNIVFSGGAGYTDPQLQIMNNSGGQGASATIILDNSATFRTTDAIFNSGMVGWVIRAGGGIAQITEYVNSAQVTVQIVAPIVDLIPNTDTPTPFVPGKWTLTDPVTQITGLDHLEGLAVTGLADGNVIPPTVVVGGSITLADPASAVTVGLGFTAQIQSMYLDAGAPTVQGRRKSVSAVIARLMDSASIEVGANQPDGAAQSPIRLAPRWSGLEVGDLNQPNLSSVPYGDSVIQGTNIVRPVSLFTGDIRVPIASGFTRPGQAALQQRDPKPVNVLAFVREYDVGDTPEQDPKPQRGQRG